jgi:hypothetical protein
MFFSGGCFNTKEFLALPIANLTRHPETRWGANAPRRGGRTAGRIAARGLASALCRRLEKPCLRSDAARVSQACDSRRKSFGCNTEERGSPAPVCLAKIP